MRQLIVHIILLVAIFVPSITLSQEVQRPLCTKRFYAALANGHVCTNSATAYAKAVEVHARAGQIAKGRTHKSTTYPGGRVETDNAEAIYEPYADSYGYGYGSPGLVVMPGAYPAYTGPTPEEQQALVGTIEIGVAAEAIRAATVVPPIEVHNHHTHITNVTRDRFGGYASRASVPAAAPAVVTEPATPSAPTVYEQLDTEATALGFAEKTSKAVAEVKKTVKEPEDKGWWQSLIDWWNN